MINDAQWVNSTNIVLGELEKVISLVKDGEIAYRGYELTFDPVYLEPYQNSKGMALSKIDVIDSLMQNDLQKQRIDTLRFLVDKQYRIIEDIIRYESNKEEADSLLRAGNRNMASLRSLVDDIKDDEWNVLRVRSWGTNDSDKITPMLIFMSFVFAIGVMVYLFSQIFKSLRTKIVAEKALEKNLMQLSKEVNEKVKAQESLQSVLDSSPNGILFMEAIKSNNEIVDFKFLLGNRGVEKHLNIPLQQILGKRLLELFDGNVRAAALDICIQATETGEEIEREFYYQDNKMEAWFYVTAVKLDEGCVLTLTDTTAQKRTAKIIEENRQKFEAIFNKAFQFIGLLDINGRFLDINQTAVEFSGTAKDMIIGKYLWSTSWGSLSKESEVRVQWAVRKAAKGEFIRYEVNVAGSHGELVPLDCSLKPIKDDQGNVSFIILEGRDLTEIKKAETERSFISMLNLTIANSNSFEQAINRIFHHIAERFELDYCEVWLPEGDELVLSKIYYAREKRFAQLHGDSGFPRLKKGEGLPGRVMETFEMQYIEDIDSVMEERFVKVDKAMDFGLTTAFGIPLIFNNEMVLVSTFFSRQQIEEVEEIINAIQQISSSLGALLLKKKTQDEIEKSNIILAAAESMAKIGSWEWNIASNKVKWSKGVYDLMHKPSNFQPTLDSFLADVYADDLEMVQGNINQAVREKTCFRSEFRVQLHGGEIKYHRGVATPKLDSSGAIEGLYGTIQDVTQHKNYEHDLLIKNEELKKSNENLEQFAYVASHDLQEPLRKIRAFGDRLQTLYEQQLGEKGRDYIFRMQGAAERMQSLIEDLLKYSRVARNRKPFTKVNLNELINGVLLDLEVTIKERNAKVCIDELPAIKGDNVQLRQLFQNLISNSIKFTPENRIPEVAVTGKKVKGAMVNKEFNYNSDRNEFVEINVQDNGIGFEAKYAERIFNIFERLNGRSEFKGTGIGLAISQKVVQNHQGVIWATSKKNKGARFTIVLPLNNNDYE